MQRKINGLTTKQILDGYMEAGPEGINYYYMTAEKFLEEIMKSPDASLLEYENGWQRKWTHKPVWVLSHGLQK